MTKAERAAQARHRQAYAERIGVEHGQLIWLLRLVDIAAAAQEREHNEPDAPDSNPAIAAVTTYARKLGFECLWPGLYPVLVKDGQNFGLPD